MKLTLEAPLEYEFGNNQLEIDVTYISEGMLNILVDGGAPDETEIEIIAKNVQKIQTAMAWELREKETIGWELQEKAWDNIQMQTGG